MTAAVHRTEKEERAGDDLAEHEGRGDREAEEPKGLGPLRPRPEGGRQRSRGRVVADVTMSNLAVLP